MDNSWIKLYRRLKDWPLYKDSEALHLWVHLLIEAQQQEYKYYVRALQKEIILQPGQLLKSNSILSLETGINESKIQRLLKDFEKCNQIEPIMIGKYRCITILKWTEYQKSEPIMNQLRTDREPIVNQEQECKNVRMKEKDSIPPVEKPATKKSSVPETFPVTDYMKDFAKKKGCFSDLEELTQQFIDHHKARRSLFDDWMAACRTWIRNDIKFSAGKKLSDVEQKAKDAIEFDEKMKKINEREAKRNAES